MLVGLIKSYFDDDVQQSDIVRFKGEITSIEEREIGSRTRIGRSNNVIFYKLNSSDYTFKISNASYAVLASNNTGEYLEIGKIVEVGTTKEELVKASNLGLWNSIFNFVLDTRINPQTYYFAYKKHQLFNLNYYNQVERKRKNNNLYLGIPFMLIGIGLFGLFINGGWKSRYDDK